MLVDQAPDGANPFAVNTGWQIARFAFCSAYLLTFHRRLVLDRRTWISVRHHWRTVLFLLTVVSTFQFVPFFWSTGFVDTADSTIVFESWPAGFILFVSLYTAKGRNLHTKPTTKTYSLTMCGFAGLACVVLSQTGDVGGVSRPPRHGHVRRGGTGHASLLC